MDHTSDEVKQVQRLNAFLRSSDINDDLIFELTKQLPQDLNIHCLDASKLFNGLNDIPHQTKEEIMEEVDYFLLEHGDENGWLDEITTDLPAGFNVFCPDVEAVFDSMNGFSSDEDEKMSEEAGGLAFSDDQQSRTSGSPGTPERTSPSSSPAEYKSTRTRRPTPYPHAIERSPINKRRRFPNRPRTFLVTEGGSPRRVTEGGSPRRVSDEEASDHLERTSVRSPSPSLDEKLERTVRLQNGTIAPSPQLDDVAQSVERDCYDGEESDHVDDADLEGQTGSPIPDASDSLRIIPRGPAPHPFELPPRDQPDTTATLRLPPIRYLFGHLLDRDSFADLEGREDRSSRLQSSLLNSPLRPLDPAKEAQVPRTGSPHSGTSDASTVHDERRHPTPPLGWRRWYQRLSPIAKPLSQAGRPRAPSPRRRPASAPLPAQRPCSPRTTDRALSIHIHAAALPRATEAPEDVERAQQQQQRGQCELSPDYCPDTDGPSLAIDEHERSPGAEPRPLDHSKLPPSSLPQTPESRPRRRRGQRAHSDSSSSAVSSPIVVCQMGSHAEDDVFAQTSGWH